jgi:hypothetical protein
MSRVFKMIFFSCSRNRQLFVRGINNIMDPFFTRDAYICTFYRYNTQLDDLEFGLCLCWEAAVVRMPAVFIIYYLYFGLILITYTLKHPLPQEKKNIFSHLFTSKHNGSRYLLPNWVS